MLEVAREGISMTSRMTAAMVAEEGEEASAVAAWLVIKEANLMGVVAITVRRKEDLDTFDMSLVFN